MHSKSITFTTHQNVLVNMQKNWTPHAKLLLHLLENRDTHVRTSWQHSPELSGVIRLERAALSQGSVNLLSPALLHCHRLRRENLSSTTLHWPAGLRSRKTPGQLQPPPEGKITSVQPSSNSHRNGGAVLVRARWGCDSATFSLKRRRWSLELAVAVDQQTIKKEQESINLRIITCTSRNPRTI